MGILSEIRENIRRNPQSDWASADLLMEDLEHGFEQLFRDYQPLLYGVAFCILKDSNLAEEAVQDAFSRAYQHLKNKFSQKEIRNLCVKAWLTAIVRNVAFDYYEERKKFIPLSLLAEEEDDRFERPDAKVVRDERAFELRTQVNMLPLHLAEVVNLRYFSEEYNTGGEEDFKSIAMKLNRPESTVRSQSRRALSRLKKGILAIKMQDVS